MQTSQVEENELATFKKNAENKGEEEEKPSEPEAFSFYLKPENTFTIISHKWGTFTILSGLIYLYHLYWTIYGVDQFCDITRTYYCGSEAQTIFDKMKDVTDADELKKLDQEAQDASSAVFDTALALVSIFHMVEWLRQTVFLTSALVNVNLVPLFYALCINVPFGFIAMLTGIVASNSEDGKMCKEGGLVEGAPGQMERGRYLQLQIICMFLYIPTMFAHIIFFKIKGVQWLHEVTQEANEEDED